MRNYMQECIDFKRHLPKPRNTEGVVWAHSLSFCSYDIQRNIEKLISILGKTNEISVTKKGEIDKHRAFGRCGAYVKGVCTLLSTTDHSSIDLDSGERVPGICAESFFVEDYNNLNPKEDSDYCECYLQPTEIVGFWAKEGFLDLVEPQAKKLGVPITIMN